MSRNRIVKSIRASGKTIYDPINPGDPDLWFTAEELESVLQSGLAGFNVKGLKTRTRSKIVKQEVARVLGYPIPGSFKKTQPRFPGQNFDTYVQTADNLQVWNEQLSASRRYVVIRASGDGILTRVIVITGAELGKLDRTGTITTKYQARVPAGNQPALLITSQDTDRLGPLLSTTLPKSFAVSPTATAESGQILPIAELFTRLSPLIGQSFPDTGSIQDRNRGAGLHNLVCAALGYSVYGDTGQFPDMPHQLLEVKLQTAPTIDLGLVLPSSLEPLGIPLLDGVQIRHCDVRYAVFSAKSAGGQITITNLVLTTGEAFFTHFVQSQGKVINGKLQIPLPSDFFDR